MGYVRIVHGQGSGKLRRALHEHMRNHPLIKNYRYGTPDEGGGSVTIVEFK
jgi:DNA mismatch repair protein MutS2